MPIYPPLFFSGENTGFITEFTQIEQSAKMGTPAPPNSSSISVQPAKLQSRPANSVQYLAADSDFSPGVRKRGSTGRMLLL